jgi:hypothetical protein
VPAKAVVQLEMLSQAGYLTARETEIIRVLRILSEATDDFVVIGGYAVNAHGQHRFSEDCNLATNRDNVPIMDAMLLGDGYELRRNEVRPPLGVTIREYYKTVEREPASIELLVDTVVSTTTRGTWTYGFIKDYSLEAIVVGSTDSTPSRVAQRNLLVAMELHSGRTQDMADVVMLSERVDWKNVARCAACGSKEKLMEHIESAIGEIYSSKFASNMKSLFVMRSDPRLLTKGAILGLQSLRAYVSEQKFRDSL